MCPSCGSTFRLDADRTQTWSKDKLPTLGKFQLLSVAGRGAFGTVYRARDLKLQRIVAVKLPRSGQLTSDEDEDRFVREARSVAQLQHPGIVPVYEVGRSETLPYIVSEFVEGITLADTLTARRFGFKESAQLIAQVAAALQHAHAHGVVHRDLKPSNIILTVDGKPRVMDFGLAKREVGEVTMTTEGQVLGTPAYMSPEQASGQAHHVDGRSDVYSLGSVLYELLTGELPFRGNQRMILHQVLHDEPRLLRSLNDRIPRDLETICLKAMSKETNRRYQSAQAMLDDLERYLSGQPITARPVGRLERSWRWCRRNPLTACLSVGFLLALVLGMAGSSYFALRAGERAQEAVTQRKVAEEKAVEAVAAAHEAQEQREFARRLLYRSNMTLAQGAWRVGNVPRALELLDQLKPTLAEPDLRGWEWNYQRALCYGDLRTLEGHARGVLSVAVSPDGGRIATASADGTSKLWDAALGTVIGTFEGHAGPVLSVAFSPDGRQLATGGIDRTVKLWDAGTGKQIRSLQQASAVTSLAFSPDGRRLVRGSHDQTVKLLDAHTGTQLRAFQGHNGVVHQVTFSPDGRRMATANDDHSVKILDAESGRELQTLQGHAEFASSVRFSPDSLKLASGSGDKTLKLWDAETGTLLRTFEGHANSVRSVAFSPDGRHLASGGEDHTVKLWNVDNGTQLRTFPGHTGIVHSVAFSPDGRQIVSGSNDATVKLWDKNGATDLGTLLEHGKSFAILSFRPDGRTLATAGSSPAIKLWDASTGAQLRTFVGHTAAVKSTAFSPDGRRLASASADKSLRLWDVETGRQLRTLEPHTAGVTAVAFSPDGSVVASMSDQIRFWNAETGTELRALKDTANCRSTLAFSPDGKQFAAAGDATVKLFNAGTGTQRCALHGHTDLVSAVAFSPDGTQLASTGGDGSIRLWDVDSAAEVHALRGHTGSVSSIAFSPDGRRLASAATDRMVKLWDVGSGAEIFSIACPQGATAACFSPDGRWLGVGGTAIVLFDSYMPTADEKMGRLLASQIVEVFPLLDESLENTRVKPQWNASMLTAARRYVEAAACTTEQAPLRVLNLLAFEPSDDQTVIDHRLAEARQLVEALRRRDPENSEYRTLLAALRWRMRDARGALELLSNAGAIQQPNNAAIYLLASHDADNAVGIDAIAESLKAASSSPADDPLASAYRTLFDDALTEAIRRGEIAHRAGRWKDAVEEFDFVSRFRSLPSTNLESYAEALAVLGRWKDSGSVWQRIQIPEDDWNKRCNCAMIWLAAENIEGYRMRCRELLPKYGETTDSGAALAIGAACILGEGAVEDPEQLVRFGRHCVQLQQLSPPMWTILGIAQFRNGRLREALHTLEKSRALHNGAALLAGDRLAELRLSQLCCLTFLAWTYHDLGEEAEMAKTVAAAEALIIQVERLEPPRDGRLAPWNARYCTMLARRELAKMNSATLPPAATDDQ